jgi:Protein of unknown function, DUF547
VRRAAWFAVAAAMLAGSCRREAVVSAAAVEVRAGVDHSDWGRLLRTYVDERGLVDYGAWKDASADRRALAAYLARLAEPAEPPAAGAERAATLINAYNALTIAWILDHYPTASIRTLADSFTAPRHTVGGRKVSLDQIEHEALRPQAGYRVHAALVCAARSCPPLRREAYTAAALETQLDAAMATWLGREDLNAYDPSRGVVRLSSIFDWFKDDFTKAGGVSEVLRRHGPAAARTLAARPDLKVEYLPYDWSLNDQHPRAAYGRLRLLWDQLRSRI